MNTAIIPYSALRLAIEDIYEAMGYGDNTPDEFITGLVNNVWQRVKETVAPCFYYKIFDCDLHPDKIIIEDIEFNTGKIIAKSLRYSQRIAAFVATAGMEYEYLVNRVKAEDDCTALFILDSIGTCLAESAGDYMEKILKDEIGDLKHTNRFSPGYCGWNVTEQQKLFSLFPKGVCNVELSESSLMYPIKSISGFMGIGEKVMTNIYSCNICELEVCFRRKKRE